MAISYKRILITTFYEYIKERLAEAHPPEEAAAPGVIKEGLNTPVKELIKKKAVVVSGDRPLVDVLKELRKKEADVIIVQDAKGGILGVVDSEDFLHIIERKNN